MDLDIQGRLITEFYEKFRSAMDEYMFLALTEDCHPLIDRCEQIVCAADNVDFQTYINGESENEDELRFESHNLAQDIMTRMIRQYAEKY